MEELLRFVECNMIFGGGTNDCICGFISPSANFKIAFVGHHNICSKKECINICCDGNKPSFYSYKNEDLRKCSSGEVWNKITPSKHLQTS